MRHLNKVMCEKMKPSFSKGYMYTLGYMIIVRETLIIDGVTKITDYVGEGNHRTVIFISLGVLTIKVIVVAAPIGKFNCQQCCS